MSIYAIDPDTSINIEISTECGYQCKYCNIENKKTMSRETFKKIIDNIDEDVDREQLKVVISGCEPLCIPLEDLFYMLDVLEEQKIQTSIITRLSIEHDKFLKIIEKLQTLSIMRRFVACISTLEEETYNQEVGNSGVELSTVIKNLLVAESSIEGFLMSFTINKITLPSAVYSLQKWLNMGQQQQKKTMTVKARRKYRFSTYIDEQYALNAEECLMLHNLFIDVQKNVPFNIINSSLCQPLCNYPDEEQYKIASNKCIGQVNNITHFGINTDGKMRACAFLPESDRLYIGDATTDKLSVLKTTGRELINNNSVKEKYEHCPSCVKYQKEWCMGGCPLEHLL